jgi:CBS domain-containing protein
MKVRDIMTRNVLTIEPECPIAQAARILGGRIRFRHLPVVKGSCLRGLLTPFDLLGHRGDLSGGGTVSSVMKTHVRTILPEAEAIEAARLMLAEGLGCLPVVDGSGRLVGILTTSDFLRIAVVSMQAQLAGTDREAPVSREAR